MIGNLALAYALVGAFWALDYLAWAGITNRRPMWFRLTVAASLFFVWPLFVAYVVAGIVKGRR